MLHIIPENNALGTIQDRFVPFQAAQKFWKP